MSQGACETKCRDPNWEDGPPDQARILKVLLYELGLYNSLKVPRFIDFYEYENFLEKDCAHRFISVTEELQIIAENVTTWHYNFTGTAGLFYMVHYATDAWKIDQAANDGLGVSMSWVRL